MRSDVDLLPIRHHISKYTHGGLMARYDRPSHPLAVPSISPYSIFFQGDWSFEATATMTWMCFQSAITSASIYFVGGDPFLNPPMMYNIVVCVGQVLLLNLTLRTAVNQPIQICLRRVGSVFEPTDTIAECGLGWCDQLRIAPWFRLFSPGCKPGQSRLDRHARQ